MYGGSLRHRRDVTKAMILAAGRGERMGALTADIPKPLLEIGEETLMARHLRRLAESGVEEVVVNLSYRGALIREVLGDLSEWGQRILYSEEGEPPLETGGGVIHALPLLGSEPFILVSADVVTDFDFSTLRCEQCLGCLVMVPNPLHHPQGDFGLTETGALSPDPPFLTYSGIAMLDPALFRGLAAGHRPLRPILDAAIARRALRGAFYEGLWQDAGTTERLLEARRLATRSR